MREKHFGPEPITIPGDWSTGVGEGEGVIRAVDSGAWPLPDQDLRRHNSFREQQRNPGKGGCDSSVREATPIPLLGDSSSSLENGRVDALGPPGQDHPIVILLSVYSIEPILTHPSIPSAMRFGRSR